MGQLAGNGALQALKVPPDATCRQRMFENCGVSGPPADGCQCLQAADAVVAAC